MNQMSDEDAHIPMPPPPRNEPFFNLPGIIIAALALMTFLEMVRQYAVPSSAETDFLLQTAFIPARYGAGGPSVDGAWFWTPISYSLIHGGWMHLILNGFWLAAFGAIVARRIGNLRFVLFWIASAIASALFFYAFHAGQAIVMVGASGVVSALMGAASRFAFRPGVRFDRDTAYRFPRLSIGQSLANRQVVTFVVVFFGINLLAIFGFTPGADSVAVAWEAHVGGFLFGFLAFAMFDIDPLSYDRDPLSAMG